MLALLFWVSLRCERACCESRQITKPKSDEITEIDETLHDTQRVFTTQHTLRAIASATYSARDLIVLHHVKRIVCGFDDGDSQLRSTGAACVAAAGVVGAVCVAAACVAAACVAAACVAAAGDRACQRRACQRREWGSAAAAVWGTRGSASPLVCTPYACPASSEGARHVVIRLWFGKEDVAGVCALPCRAGETHSSMHAQHAGSSRVRARRSAAGDGRQAHRDLGRHHHAMIMTWAGWTRHVKASRAA